MRRSVITRSGLRGLDRLDRLPPVRYARDPMRIRFQHGADRVRVRRTVFSKENRCHRPETVNDSQGILSMYDETPSFVTHSNMPVDRVEEF